MIDLNDQHQGRIFEAVLLHDPVALGDLPDLHLALEAGLGLEAKLVFEVVQGKYHHILAFLKRTLTPLFVLNKKEQEILKQ